MTTSTSTSSTSTTPTPEISNIPNIPDIPQPIYLPPPIQGKSDYRRYRPLLIPYPSPPTPNEPNNELNEPNEEPNNEPKESKEPTGLTIILVQDPQSKHLAASVSVHAGASCDPWASVLPSTATTSTATTITFTNDATPTTPTTSTNDTTYTTSTNATSINDASTTTNTNDTTPTNNTDQLLSQISLPGLAHFVEHMCFLGSSSYPAENEYKRYLALHGGKSNASTSMSGTTFQFDVLAADCDDNSDTTNDNEGNKDSKDDNNGNNDGADNKENPCLGALDRFTSFFTSPLFTPSGTNREVQAVDSENSKNLISDGRRRLQVLKSLGDNGVHGVGGSDSGGNGVSGVGVGGGHHFCKFSTGNRWTLPAFDDFDDDGNDGSNSSDEKTSEDDHPLQDILSQLLSIELSKLSKLSNDSKGSNEFQNYKATKADLSHFVRASLLAFHRRHYRPQNMTVVVVGPQSLDRLEEWVVPRFGRMRDRWRDGEDGMEDADESGTPTATTISNATNATSTTNTTNFTSKEQFQSQKWNILQNLASKLIHQSALHAPPVSAAKTQRMYGKEYGEYDWNNSAFRPELQGGRWPVLVTTLPLQDVRKLILSFPLPPTSYTTPDQSPTRLLSHLFGHEGPGSIFALLQDRGWISSLSAGNRISAADQSLFQVEVGLTEEGEGEGRWKEVVGSVFGYARLVSGACREAMESKGVCPTESEHSSPLHRIWHEISLLDQMRFHQTSPGQVYNFAPSLAQSASRFGTTHCLSAGSMLEEDGSTLPLKMLVEFSERIRDPENCFIERCSKGAWEEMELLYGKEGEGMKVEEEGLNYGGDGGYVFGKKKEKWYGVEYYVSPLDDVDIERWKTGSLYSSGVEEQARESISSLSLDELHLPAPNRYIPRSLELCSDLPEEARQGPRIEKKIDPPKLLVNDDAGRLWHRLDDRYALPKASIKFLIRTALAENKVQPDKGRKWDYDSETAILSHFITGIFANAMAQDTYDSYMAGLGWSLSKGASGYTLSCSGYSDRLSDLALKLLEEFFRPRDDGTSKTSTNSGSGEMFLQESHFVTTKDRMVRGLKSFFESRRADSLAFYYRDLLMNSKGDGAEKNLEIAQGVTLEQVVRHHQRILMDGDVSVECLYMGNVSEKEANSFFEKATGIMKNSRLMALEKWGVGGAVEKYRPWVPGPFERRLKTGDDIELHFQSKNPKEENGAVTVTFQSSQIPGFKGKHLSSEESLRHCAIIRLICTMLREPLFNELRTKQQLGYIVSSYYDVNYSTRQLDYFDMSPDMDSGPLTSAVESIVVYVLSRKEKPMEIVNRIDDFLVNFRSRLEEMPKSEVEKYADSLANQLTKPIRKLDDEVGRHFSKIRRYAPETLAKGSQMGVGELPWDNAKVLAGAVRNVKRENILEVWDKLVINKESRSRVTSIVYGKTFPMEFQQSHSTDVSSLKFSGSSLESLMLKRNTLIPYDQAQGYNERRHFGSSLWSMIGGKNKTTVRYVAAATAVIGLGAWGLMAMKSRDSAKKSTKA